MHTLFISVAAIVCRLVICMLAGVILDLLLMFDIYCILKIILVALDVSQDGGVVEGRERDMGINCGNREYKGYRKDRVVVEGVCHMDFHVFRKAWESSLEYTVK